MEGAPKIPPKETKKKATDIIGVVVGSAIAAVSPVNKVAHAPEGIAPLTTEKQVVRPKDMDDQVLKDEIDSYRAKFEISKDGEIKRVEGNKE